MKLFVPFHLDDADGTLWHGRDEVSLTRKAAALLRCLVDRAGTSVGKADIMNAVWPDTHVHPDNVKVLVREIRRALGDDSRTPTFIRADAGHGYTFIAPVTESRNANVVGRSRELATLVEALDGVRAGSPRVVLIGGERGAGKSALCDMFLRMTGAAAAIRSCYGECRPAGPADEPLAPIMRALVHLERQAPGLVRGVLETRGALWLARFLHPSDRLDALHAHDAADALPDVVQQLARHVPLVIVLEDLQWADPATLAAIHSLSQQRGPAKWLLIGTYCPYGPTAEGRAFQTGISRLSAERRTKTLALGPLATVHVRQYLDERLGAGCLSGLAPAMATVTGGNPGMLVKLVDDLIGCGAVAASTESYRSVLTPEAVEGLLPQLLAETFRAELDALDSRSRAALEIASLAGATFTSGAVAAAWNVGVSGVEHVFARLARRGHIIRAAPGPTLCYAFRHPAYADLLARSAPFAQQMRAARRLDDREDSQLLRA
jgi:DNA-binding winged helix-turn-helix (wHTH) protein